MYTRIAVIVILIIVFLLITKSKEPFTALGPIQGTLTSYDDYGTFNFIHHFNDFPWYDSTYSDMGCSMKNDSIGLSWKCCDNNKIQCNKDGLRSYIKYDGDTLRRKMIPSNYSDHPEYADADFTKNMLHILVRPDRPKTASSPPQPYNIYYGEYPN